MGSDAVAPCTELITGEAMSTKACGGHAAFRYTWPGKAETFACIDHAMQVAGIASAMGLPLQLIPIAFRASDPVPEEWPTCSQQVTESAPDVCHSGRNDA
jgi:hypothetical protein